MANLQLVQECQGNCSDLTKGIARLGSNGKYPANMERDLYRLLKLPLVACRSLVSSTIKEYIYIYVFVL